MKESYFLGGETETETEALPLERVSKQGGRTEIESERREGEEKHCVSSEGVKGVKRWCLEIRGRGRRR